MAHLAPLVKAAADLDLDIERVMGASIFTTMDPSATMKDLASWAEALPLPELSEGWTVTEEHQSYQVLTGRYEVPVVQSGNRPYTSLGEEKSFTAMMGTPSLKRPRRPPGVDHSQNAAARGRVPTHHLHARIGRQLATGH